MTVENNSLFSTTINQASDKLFQLIKVHLSLASETALIFKQLHTTLEDLINLYIVFNSVITSCTYLLLVMRHRVLHSAYIQQKRQVVQNMFGERCLVCVHKEFGQSVGPKTLSILGQKLL